MFVPIAAIEGVSVLAWDSQRLVRREPFVARRRRDEHGIEVIDSSGIDIWRAPTETTRILVKRFLVVDLIVV